MKIKLIIILAMIYCSCNEAVEKYKFWDISQFKINPVALKNYESVKLIYASNGPDHNEKRDYYYHIIAVSHLTGDTVNILTIYDNAFSQEDQNENYTYINSENPFSDSINFSKSLTEQTLNNAPIKKVARDPQFDAISKNNYHTVIGVVGTSTSGKVEE